MSFTITLHAKIEDPCSMTDSLMQFRHSEKVDVAMPRAVTDFIRMAPHPF